MSTDDASERRLAEALRARATGAGRPSAHGPLSRDEHARWALDVDIRGALLIALLGGAALGVALAVLSLLVPGVLPALG